MWKNSISKAGVYLSAFVLGYAAGHINPIETEPATDESVATTANTVATASCPPTTPTRSPEFLPIPPKPTMAAQTIAVSYAKETSIELEEVRLTDFANPDEQILSVLTVEQTAFGQSSEQLIENEDPLDAMFDLPQKQQLDYVKTLITSQEDSAIAALNNLILTDNTEIQKAAIDGMLELLEMRTGHYEILAQNLQENSVFLSEDQLHKLEKITQIAAQP